MRSRVQALRVILNMVTDERRNEVVTVIVAWMRAQLEGITGLRARCLEEPGLQLVDEKLIVEPLVDEDRLLGRRLRHQQGRVVLRPARAILAQIIREGLHAPWTLGGGDDR